MISYMKEKLILVIIFVALLSLAGYLLINYHFSKSIQLKAFSECILTVESDSSNWIARRGTLEYCSNEVKKLVADL